MVATTVMIIILICIEGSTLQYTTVPARLSNHTGSVGIQVGLLFGCWARSPLCPHYQQSPCLSANVALCGMSSHNAEQGSHTTM